MAHHVARHTKMSKRSFTYVTSYMPERDEEAKLMDTDISAVFGAVIDTTNTNEDIAVLNLIDPGPAAYNRIGRRVFLKSVRLFGELRMALAPEAPTTMMTSLLVRFVLVWDKQPSGVLPTFDQIFGSTLRDGTNTVTYIDKVLPSQMERFRIIGEWFEKAEPNFYDPDYQVYLSVFDRLMSLRETSVYSGQTSPCTIADISSGALYLIARANQNADSFATIALAPCRARLQYTD